MINMIVLTRLTKQQATQGTAGFVVVGDTGVVQHQGDVINLIAKRLVDHTPLLGRLQVESRDFC